MEKKSYKKNKMLKNLFIMVFFSFISIQTYNISSNFFLNAQEIKLQNLTDKELNNRIDIIEQTPFADKLYESNKLFYVKEDLKDFEADISDSLDIINFKNSEYIVRKLTNGETNIFYINFEDKKLLYGIRNEKEESQEKGLVSFDALDEGNYNTLELFVYSNENNHVIYQNLNKGFKTDILIEVLQSLLFIFLLFPILYIFSSYKTNIYDIYINNRSRETEENKKYKRLNFRQYILKDRLMFSNIFLRFSKKQVLKKQNVSNLLREKEKQIKEISKNKMTQEEDIELTIENE